jgi:anti-sigma B factor antagonist
MEEEMEIRSHEKHGVLVLSLKGRLDFTTSNTLKEEILKHITEGRNRILLNLNQIDFVNSSGLGTLVSILKEIRLAKGRMALTNLATYVQEIFEITQLSHIFEIFTSEAEAMETFMTSPARTL